ncbi:LytTR family DNA-binding domain-containing protein [Tyzzerella sp. OttesenSCG-928-J15]|nr:LytTR family DNA-binding domain-containing protein [Tyzzerella sp. OttesenSCG-928-J15]
MNIIICDDEPSALTKLENLVNTYLPASIQNVSISKCTSGEEVLELCHSKRYGMAFLDIQMKGISGLETAKLLRKDNDDLMIVFMTNYKEHSIEGYEVRIFRYMLKNKDEAYYQKNLEAIFTEYINKHREISIVTRKFCLTLPLSDICYFDVNMRKTTLYLMNGQEYICPKSLTEIESDLIGYAFIRPHKSYLVNLANVEYIGSKDLVMKNGKTVFISRGYRQALQYAFAAYYLGR